MGHSTCRGGFFSGTRGEARRRRARSTWIPLPAMPIFSTVTPPMMREREDETDRPSRLEYRSSGPSLRVPANMVVDRATLAALMHGAESGEVVLSPERIPEGAGGRYGFEPIAVCSPDSRKAAENALLRSLR